MSQRPAEAALALSGAPPLQLEGVCKTYGGRSVLRDIGFSLQPGEIFGLVGLNGAGKTTLIKIMLDLTRADAGHALWFGEPATQAAARRCLSYLPEKFQPSRYLKGGEYLALTLAAYGRTLAPGRAEAMAEALDLAPRVLRQRVGSYSKGMGQKLGLLGTLLADTPVLLLDEPMSGLDPRARIRLKEALLAAKREGKTVFFSSHILSDLDEICDRIAVIHEGQLRHVGAPADFRAAQGGLPLEQAFLASIDAGH